MNLLWLSLKGIKDGHRFDQTGHDHFRNAVDVILWGPHPTQASGPLSELPHLYLLRLPECLHAMKASLSYIIFKYHTM